METLFTVYIFGINGKILIKDSENDHYLQTVGNHTYNLKKFDNLGNFLYPFGREFIKRNVHLHIRITFVLENAFRFTDSIISRQRTKRNRKFNLEMKYLFNLKCIFLSYPLFSLLWGRSFQPFLQNCFEYSTLKMPFHNFIQTFISYQVTNCQL